MKDKRFQGSKKKARRRAFAEREAHRKWKAAKMVRYREAIIKHDILAAIKLMAE